MPDLDLDGFDKNLLRLLQIDNRISNQELADKVGLSPPACLRRVRRLRESGIIASDVSILDPKRVGPSFWALVLVECERERSDLLNDMKRMFLKQPEIIQCFVVTGPADFALLVVTDSIEKYDLFAENVFRSNENIKQFETMAIMSRVKLSLTIPI